MSKDWLLEVSKVVELLRTYEKFFRVNSLCLYYNRCLCETGGNHLVIPISINYEIIPEQSSLAIETDGKFRKKMSILDLFHG